MVSVLLPTPPFPEPIATRCLTRPRLVAMRACLALTCSMTFEPPSPEMSK